MLVDGSSVAVCGVRAPWQAAARSTRLSFLLSGIGMAAWAPMVPYAKARLGLDDAQLGAMLLAFGGGSMVSMPFVGWLAPRLGNRRVILAAGLLLCPALPLLALAPDVVALVLALLVFGAALGAVDVAMNAHAVEVERRSGQALMSGFHGVFSVGGLTGAVAMSALLASGLPLPAAAGMVAVLLAALLLWLRGGLLRDEPAPARLPRATRRWQWPHPLVWLLGGLCFVSFLAEGAMLDWSAVLLREVRGFAPAWAGVGYAAFSIAMAAVRLGGDRLVARFGPMWMVGGGAALAATGFLMVATLPWAAGALLGFVLIGLGAANIVPVLFGAAGRLPGTAPALGIATVTSLGYAGLLSGPALVGFVAQASSLPLALAAIAGLLLLLAAAARVVRPGGTAMSARDAATEHAHG